MAAVPQPEETKKEPVEEGVNTPEAGFESEEEIDTPEDDNQDGLGFDIF